jgi:methanogenic corrinoid protein MtbC1
MAERAEAFKHALLAADWKEARRLVVLTEAVSRLSSMEMISKALSTIGAGWQMGECSLSQVYMSGRICEELVNAFADDPDMQHKNHPPIAIATLDPHHLLGKQIVYSVLRASGYSIKDYGCISCDELVDRVKADGIKVLLLSALMLPSALKIREVTTQLKLQHLDVKVIVGGAPFLFDSQLWKDVQADAMGRSASEAPGLIDAVLGIVA